MTASVAAKPILLVNNIPIVAGITPSFIIDQSNLKNQGYRERTIKSLLRAFESLKLDLNKKGQFSKPKLKVKGTQQNKELQL